jgi:hypothetical protein
VNDGSGFFIEDYMNRITRIPSAAEYDDMKIKKFLTSRKGIPIVILIIVLWNVFRFTLGYFEIIYRDLRMPFEIRPSYDGIILLDTGTEEGDPIAYLQKGDKQLFLTRQGEIRKADIKAERDSDILNSLDTLYWDPDTESVGFVTLGGKDVIPPGRFKELIPPFDHNRMIAANNENEYCLIDTNANIVKELTNLNIYSMEGFSEGLSVFTKHKETATEVGLKRGYIDTNGEVAVDAQFFDARNFVNGYAAVSKYFGRDENGGIIERWGLIDKQGRLVIDCKYLDIGDYGEGLIAFSTEEIEVGRGFYIKNGSRNQLDVNEKRNLYGYMDINENTIIEPQYVEASRFRYGTARVIPVQNERLGVLSGYEWRYIDKDNNTLSELKYFVYCDEVDRNDGYIVLRNNTTGKVGIIKNPSAMREAE